MRFCLFIALCLAPLLGCTDPPAHKAGVHPCQNDRDCGFGLKCADEVCVDRSQTEGSPKEQAAFTQKMLEKSEALKKTTAMCEKTLNCIQFGRCQGTPDGECIVAETSHCENAKISCKRRGFCVWSPELLKCCKDEAGKECEE